MRVSFYSLLAISVRGDHADLTVEFMLKPPSQFCSP